VIPVGSPPTSSRSVAYGLDVILDGLVGALQQG
jgi:hypothetical protein